MKRATFASLFSLFAFLSLAATQQIAHSATCSFSEFDVHGPYPPTCSLTAEVTFGTGSSISKVAFHCDGPGFQTRLQEVGVTGSGPADIFVPADGATVDFPTLSAGNYNAWALAYITASGGGNGNASTGDHYFTVSHP